MTRILAHIKKAQGDLAGATTVLCELQVETFGSMDRREKTDFILEQVDLCIQKGDYTPAVIFSRKISTKYITNPDVTDLKLRYYDQQIQLAKQEDKYLDACKHYRQVYDTPSVIEDPVKLKSVIYPKALMILRIGLTGHLGSGAYCLLYPVVSLR